jgi:predicted metal-dependent phosphoesterase TrpH
MPNIFADLHNHSTASDGELSPSEVVKQAAVKGYKAVSLTDHDTLNGIAEALASGARNNITVIPGIELTLRLKRPEFVGSLHLLLYFKPELLDKPDFIDATRELCASGRGAALIRSRVSAINHFFGPNSATARQSGNAILKRELTVAEVERCGDNITRRHFAKVLSENHKLERHQVDTIIANQSPAYLPSGIDPDKILSLRRNFPLLIFLAHPAAGSFPPPSHYREVLPPWSTVAGLLPEFLAPEPIRIDGLEIEYPGHREVDKVTLREIAEANSLLVSGGSDGHDLQDRAYSTCGIGREDFSRFLNRYEALQ